MFKKESKESRLSSELTQQLPTEKLKLCESATPKRQPGNRVPNTRNKILSYMNDSTDSLSSPQKADGPSTNPLSPEEKSALITLTEGWFPENQHLLPQEETQRICFTGIAKCS